MNSNQHVRTEVHEETRTAAAPGAGYPHEAPIAAPTGHAQFEHEKEKGGVLHNIKEGVKEAIGMGRKSPTPKDHAKEAKHLHGKAEDVLDDVSKEFKKAEKAQAKADKEAFKANVKTEKALNKQAKGQELLAEAGAEMVQAGTKMQRNAAISDQSVPFNAHQKGEVHQTTCVSTAGQSVPACGVQDPATVRGYGGAR